MCVICVCHVRSWGNAFPEIIVQCHKAANRNENPGNVYALDPSHPDTMEIIREILIQIANTFPSVYIHVGGDEVILDCWRESKTLVITCILFTLLCRL
jgi:hexosaminidase